MKKIKFLALVLTVVAGAVIGPAAASADDGSGAFLCPVVSDSVASVADAHNGDNGVSAILPPVGTSFLPGNNQAGHNANSNAWNTQGPGETDAGPGGNPDFSPIWPG